VLNVESNIEPMLSKAAGDIPEGDEWVYEPKWDGFRALIYRDGDHCRIVSRKQTLLNRYFPEVLSTLAEGLPPNVVVDGEIIMVGARGLEFETLQLRLHPAASRVDKLSTEIPASFVAFDILALGQEDLRSRPLTERRRLLLETVTDLPRLCVTPQTDDIENARAWFTQFEGAGLDGVIAKRVNQGYLLGKREWIKIKHQRTADCVVGGYRVGADGKGVGSLLLGLYDDSGVLNHVGHTSSFSAQQKRDLLETLAVYRDDSGFADGRGPGGPSRWSQGRDLTWVSLRPDLVCEVGFEKLEGTRFRHAARFLRWRPDKSPQECTYDQLEPPTRFDLADVMNLGRAR
jgi:ATP-dependent DNA ligase